MRNGRYRPYPPYRLAPYETANMNYYFSLIVTCVAALLSCVAVPLQQINLSNHVAGLQVRLYCTFVTEEHNYYTLRQKLNVS